MPASRAWTAAALAVAAPVLTVLGLILWRTPYPLSEGVALLEDVANPSSFAFLVPHTYYRPLYHLTLFAAWHSADSPAAFVTTMRLLVIVPVALLAVLFVLHVRLRTAIDAATATLALAVLVGSPAFLDNIEMPLVYTTVGMPLLLIVWTLSERRRRPWHAVVLVALTAIAIGFKEQGLVIVPVVLALWWTGAPGVSRAAALAVTLLAGGYVLVRISMSTGWAPFEQDIGYGFTVVGTRDAAARFGSFPIAIYAYNAASTIANVLFAEPSAGVFAITRALVRGDALPWHYLRLASSAVMTGLILWWSGHAVARARALGWTEESRAVVVLVVALAASGALSFNYSRDRLGGMALVPYAVAAFFAVRAALSRLAAIAVVPRLAAVLALVVLATAWDIRMLSTLEGARKRAADNYREWLVDLSQRRLDFASRPDYSRILNALAEQGTAAPAERPLRYSSRVRDLIGPF